MPPVNNSAMLEETQPPGTTDIDMMKVAMEADAAQPDGPLGTEAKPKETAQPQSDAPALDKDGKPTATGNDGKPAANGSAKPEDKKAEAKPGEKKESDFAKAKGEQERRDKSWKALEAEKEAFRSERGALNAELQGLRREVSELRKRPQVTEPAKDPHGLTASDYDKIAKDYRDQGNDSMAEAARERADSLRKQAPAATAAPTNDFAAPEFQAEWKRHTAELIQQDPELGNPESPVVKAANTLLQDGTYGRFFRSAPDGIKAAVEVAKLMREAHSAQALKAQLTTSQEDIKTKQAEIDRLNGLLQPRGSHPASPATGRKQGEPLSDADVREIAAMADRGELTTS